jgi:hypothetical protein
MALLDPVVTIAMFCEDVRPHPSVGQARDFLGLMLSAPLDDSGGVSFWAITIINCRDRPGQHKVQRTYTYQDGSKVLDEPVNTLNFSHVGLQACYSAMVKIEGLRPGLLWMNVFVDGTCLLQTSLDLVRISVSERPYPSEPKAPAKPH